MARTVCSRERGFSKKDRARPDKRDGGRKAGGGSLEKLIEEAPHRVKEEKNSLDKTLERNRPRLVLPMKKKSVTTGKRIPKKEEGGIQEKKEKH